MRLLWCLPAARETARERTAAGAGSAGDLASPLARELLSDLAALGESSTALVAAPAALPDHGLPAGVAIERCVRLDPNPCHWQRSRSSAAAARFAEVLAASAAEVALVAGWRGLSLDLVELAALSGVPAIVLLDEPAASCLLHTRRLPESGLPCDAPLAASPCLACARGAGLATPWVPVEAQHLSLAELCGALARELALARAVVATEEDERALSRHLELDLSRVAFARLPAKTRAGRAAAFRELCSAAVASGPPPVAVPRDDWFGARMRRFAEEDWDRHALARAHGGTG